MARGTWLTFAKKTYSVRHELKDEEQVETLPCPHVQVKKE